ncbi:radical SAM protein [Alkalicella caledoniensis]|uniref:Radical SAM protein n=1 Tax=Alkalicella caledoniensis TaxID=2731377 RepID=A0A7G9WA48_ALKCA|nr:radical SAM protein [Alkalicella caledoniensis]QNO15560.1 radical SAM protein [Alkalicella caledoniensis]
MSFTKSNNRIPEIGHFEITRDCNNKCGFCYNFKDEKEELSTEQIFSLIDQVVDKGCIYINISGGEPLLRRDFSSIYEYIIKAGVRVSIETNASLLTKDMLDLFEEFPPSKILASLYGYYQKTYRIVTRSSVDVEVVKNNIIDLRNICEDVLVRTPVTRDNFQELYLIERFGKEVNCKFSYDPKIWWRQDGKRNAKYRCTSREVYKMLTVSPIYKELYRKVVELEQRPYTISGCNWGKKEFYINPYGEMHYCIVFWANKYDLTKGNFKEAWDVWYERFNHKKCVGKLIYPTQNNCPAGYIYYHTSIDPIDTLNDFNH